jgi:hopanoid biosynthesis associated RND transporter like protein HpnN
MMTSKKLPFFFYSWIFRYPRTTVFLGIILTLFCAIPTLIFPCPPFPHLTTKTGTVHLLSEEHLAGKAFKEYIHHFGTPETLILVLESPPQRFKETKAHLQQIFQKLESPNPYIKSLRYRLSLEFLKKRGFYFLQKKELLLLEESVQQFKNLIPYLEKAPNLLGLFAYIQEQLLESEKLQIIQERDIVLLEQFRTLLTQIAEKRPLQNTPALENTLSSSGSQKRFQFVEEEGYFCIQRPGAAYFLLFIEPSNPHNDFEFNQKFLTWVQKEVQQIPLPFPELKFGYTGSPALNVAEMRDSQKDMLRGTLLSFVLVFIFFVGLYHRSPWHPLGALFCLILGIVWTFCFTAFYPGYLNLLSMTFALILIGLGIDFGIHLLSRFEEELKKHPPEEALLQTLSHVGPALWISALTTSGAFFTTMLSDFKGFSELGLIAGVGILICLLLMFVFLPPLLLLATRPSISSSSGSSFFLKPFFHLLEKIFSFFFKLCIFIVSLFQKLFAFVSRFLLVKILYRFPGTVLGITLLLTLYFAYSASFLSYDQNILNLQSKGSPEVATMEKILSIGEFGVLIYEGKPYSEAQKICQELLEKLMYQGYQRYTFSLFDVLPPNQEQTKKHLDRFSIPSFKTTATDFELSSFQEQVEILNELFRTLHSLLKKPEASQAGPLRFELAQVIDSSLPHHLGIISLLEELEKQQSSPLFSPFLQEFSRNYIQQLQKQLLLLQELKEASPFTLEDLPADIKNIFVSATGKYHLIQVFPRGDVFEGQTLEKFVENLTLASRTTSSTPQPVLATGHPVMVYEMVNSIREGYEDASWTALLVIFLIVLFSFRHFFYALLAVLSVVVALIWTFGLLALIPGGNLNPANMIALPFLLGIGIDNAVHLIHRFREEHRLESTLQHTGKAILTSTLTTLFGFLGMCIGHHQGLISLGQTLILGMICCVSTCFIVIPALLLTLFKAKAWFLGETYPHVSFS